jgi:hypothetical protein
MSVGIMTPCPLIVWQTGCALVAQELVIHDLPIGMALNMATKTWPFSIRLVPSIAYFARTGISAA